MDTKNVKGMKLLGFSEMEPFFEFQIKEITTVFEPSRLLKCTWNLFREYDDQLKSDPLGNQPHGIAEWTCFGSLSICPAS
jgi:hypothetical protein